MILNKKTVQLYALLITKFDLEWVFIDSTHIKAHRHSNGNNEVEQAISKSIAICTTKIYLIGNAHGKTTTFILSDATVHNVKVTPNLVDTDMVCADKNYNSDTLREHINQAGIFNNIPKKIDRKQSHEL